MSAKQNKLGSKKVEELILIQEKKKQVDDFKEHFKEQLQAQGQHKEPFRLISVDTVISSLARDDEPEDMFLSLVRRNLCSLMTYLILNLEKTNLVNQILK